MKTRANFLVAGLILCAGLAHGQAPAHSRNGYWWLKQSRSLKLGWVVGFVDGSEAVRTGVTGSCLEQASGGLQTAAQDESAAKVCNNDQGLNRFKPPNATYGHVIDGLDHFYADYRNKNDDARPRDFLCVPGTQRRPPERPRRLRAQRASANREPITHRIGEGNEGLDRGIRKQDSSA